MLLLGASNSGKTTVLKQMKLAYSVGFSITAKQEYRSIVLDTLVSGMQALVIMCRIHSVDFSTSSEFFSSQLSCYSLNTTKNTSIIGRNLPLYIIQAITGIWGLKAVQDLFQRICLEENNTLINASLEYVLGNLDRILEFGMVNFRQHE